MSAFRPPRWLGNAHVQTIGAAAPWFAPPRSFVEPEVEVLRVPVTAGQSGAQGALRAEAWWHPEGEGEARTTVILVHGVGGSSRSRYVVRAAVALYRAGHHVVRLNLQGAGEGLADAAVLYHAGLTADLEAAVRVVAADRRTRDVVLLGFSLGGNLALKLAGEWGDAPAAGVRAVAALSPALDLDPLAHEIDRAPSVVYRMWILTSLVATAREFARLHPGQTYLDVGRLRWLTSIREHDTRVVVPMHGFAHVEDYYARSSSGPWLAKVTLPTLLIHADDDPLVPGWTLRPWLEKASPSVTIDWTERGGHVGWFGGFDEEGWVRTWAMRRVIAFVQGATAVAPAKDSR